MTVTFPSGDLSLEGRLALPPDGTHAAVVCHPHPQYGGDMDNAVVRAVAGAFESLGYATLRFNFRGVGRSRGAYDNGRGEVEDVRAAVRCVQAHVDASSVTLAGYSFGAVMALQAGMPLPEVARLVAVAAPVVALQNLGALSGCDKPRLFIVGDRDPFCDLSALQQQIMRLPEPKLLKVVPGADHFFAGYEAAVSHAVLRFVRSGNATR
jgi:alpha/beta superfamily hydrolase